MRRLSTNRFVAVVGTSGSGKSSLVRAGLLPALYRGFLAGDISHWRVAVMKPGDAPMANLAHSLAEQKVPVEDRGLAEALNRSQYLIPRLTREQRREAIEKPASLVDAEIAPRLVQRILNELGEDPDQLPVLQHVLARTFRKWEGAGGAGPIDFFHYEAAKSLEGALNDHADSLMLELSEGARPWTEKVFRALTTTQASGRAVRWPLQLGRLYEVLGIKADDDKSRALLREVISKYADRDNSLLVISPAGKLTPDTVVDISHESLIARWGKLKKWAEQESQAVTWYRGAEEDTRRHERNEAPTWRDPKLSLAFAMAYNEPWNAAWAERNFPHSGTGFDQVRAFLDKGASEQRSEQRKKRVTWIALLSLLVGAVIATGAFAWERSRAVAARDQVIELQHRIVALDRQVQAKEAEKAQIQQQLKHKNLTESERDDLKRQLEATSGQLVELKATRAEAEKKAQAGELQIQNIAAQQTMLQDRVASLQAALTKAQQDRDGYKKQLDSAPKDVVSRAEYQKAMDKITELEGELKKGKTPATTGPGQQQAPAPATEAPKQNPSHKANVVPESVGSTFAYRPGQMCTIRTEPVRIPEHSYARLWQLPSGRDLYLFVHQIRNAKQRDDFVLFKVARKESNQLANSGTYPEGTPESFLQSRKIGWKDSSHIVAVYPELCSIVRRSAKCRET